MSNVCEIKLSDGRLLRRHLDHVKVRQAEEISSPTVHDPAEHPLPEVNVPVDAGSPPVPNQPLTSDSTSAPVVEQPLTPPVTLRRSTRVSKPPVRLDT